jgi:hypothetical protein
VRKSQYKLFVSYSHKNSIEARQFIEAFRTAFLASPDLEISPEQVFFDRERLLAGDQWGELIQQAMDESKYFVILLSPESIASEYCLNRELGTAVAKGLPIIQVLLSQCTGWADLVVLTDLKMRKLGSFGALPKDDNFNYLPIAEWPEASREEVWKRVAHDILERVRRDKMEPSQLFALEDIPRHAQERIGPPIPYFCNQRGPVSQFNEAVRTWNDKALLVVTRGLDQDGVPRFWDRLQNKHLGDYIKKRKEEILLSSKPFPWPGIEVDAESLRLEMLLSMSNALTGNLNEFENVASLSTYLTATPGIRPLIARLPLLPVNEVSEGLRALLDLLEQCPVETPLHRLVIAVLLEDSTFVQEPALEKKLNISAYLRTQVVVLDPLQVIQERDVSIWHHEYEVERLYQIDEDTLLQEVFVKEQATSLRLREFAKKVAPFIKTMERTL